MYPDCLARVSRYVAARQFALDPQPLASYLDRHGLPADLGVAEHDLARVLARARALAGRPPRSVACRLPARAHEAGHVSTMTMTARHLRRCLLRALWAGRLHGRIAPLDDDGNGCLLALLAALVGIADWTILRARRQQPLLLEVLVRAVCPGETPATNPVLGLLALWLADVTPGAVVLEAA
jgi:hypothetical protein